MVARLLVLPLYLLVLLLPLESLELAGTTLPRLAVVATLAAAALLVTVRLAFPLPERHERAFYLFLLLPFLLGLVIVASGVVGAGDLRIRPALSGMTQPLLALATVVLLRHNPAAPARIAWMLIGIGVLLGLVSFGQVMGVLPTTGGLEAGRAELQFLPFPRNSPLPIYGTYGVLSSFALGLMLARLHALPKTRLLRIAPLLAGVGAVLLGVVITQDRSTLLATGSLLAAFSLFVRSRALRWLLVGTVIVGAIVVLGPLIRFLVSVNLATVVNRLATYQMGLDAFRSSPLVGIGWDMRAITNDAGRVIHNTFVAILAYLGILGLLIHTTAYAGVAWLARRGHFEGGPHAWIHMGIALGTIGWFIENMFYLGIRNYTIWILLGLVLHMLTAREAAPAHGPGTARRVPPDALAAAPGPA